MKSQAPPTLPKNKQPFVRILMPVVMVVAVVGMVAAMVLSGMGRSPMAFIFPLMMLGSLAMMISPGGQDVDEVRRGFHRHLDALSDSLHRARRDQWERAAVTQPHPQSLWTFADAGSPGGEQTHDVRQVEPGVVRIGTAVQTPDDPLEIPVDAPPEDLEPVCATTLRNLAGSYATIDAPVAVDLREFDCVVVTGEGAPGLVRAMQGQIVVGDDPGVRVTGPHDRWLSGDGALHARFVHLGGPGGGDQGGDAVGLGGDVPVPLSGAVTVLADPGSVAPVWHELAATGGLLLHAQDGALSAWTVDGWRPFATADELSDVELAAVCRSRSVSRASRSVLDVPGGGLRAAIGFSPAPVYLDIREAAQGGIGPHGLCIGATGSGKSELLRAVVTSFAHRHSAEELNFVLIDFKGGAAFAGMERLPHTSAVITNLSDEAVLVDRMQDSLLGELHRRQERLHAAGLATAAEYNRVYPGTMPALFVIVDEFSELLHARPEFAEVFAAIGRLGRSLQIHLLLASQRLEEGRLRGLESHLSYRIALRTFSATESRQLIGSTAAYELPSTPGSAILSSIDQVRFQAAYVSGPEAPLDSRLVRELGVEPESAGTTMDLVIDRLEGPNRTPIWLEPLPELLPASAVMGEPDPPPVALTVRLGLEDLPFDGVQRAFLLDLRRRHWAVVGQPGTGKTTLVRSLVLGLALSSPGVGIYVVDPGGSLHDLGRLPQVAAVVGAELLPRLLDELEQDDPDGAVGHRVLVVDGLDAVGDEDRRLAALVAGGMERGVHVVVTSLRWTFRPGLRDLLTGAVELRLTPSESVFRDAQRILPDHPGRGVSPDGKHLQVAYSDAQDVEHVRKVSAARGEQSRTMRVLPEVVGAGELDEASGAGIPVGVGGPRLSTVCWDPDTFPHLTVVGQSRAGGTTTLHTVAQGAADRAGTEVLSTDVRRGLLGAPGYRPVATFITVLTRWIEELTARIPGEEVELTPESLRERSWWSGTDRVIVVDDLDQSTDLASAVDQLVPLLPHAADIGLHLVTARRSALVGRAAYTPLMQGTRDLTAWILLSAPREDGPVAGQVLSPRPPGRGVLVQGTVEDIQVATVSQVDGSEAVDAVEVGA
ncbi:FtsK/SpoIIIE domain-containing protein [Corynebacterium glyciniphilum]|uniref:FtsK/SpoIIIE domain-containing protein n=1 Tax=Corynebacterium glyciniphilum TaxID=1404244 RepID=UPI002653FEE5|nr:FtsK/SpoIIIE domain-containing protein [Corynebacterium glyciniphilum]MDN6705134.1 cell division protein FtsK [Corynebacterium glyciniphilum]